MQGKSIQEVKENLAKFHKVPLEKVDFLFTGKAITVREKVDQYTALNIKKAYERAGARCMLLELVENKPAPSMVCPKCKAEQPQSPQCSQCGIMIDAYSPDDSQEEQEDSLPDLEKTLKEVAESVAKIAKTPTAQGQAALDTQPPAQQLQHANWILELIYFIGSKLWLSSGILLILVGLWWSILGIVQYLHAKRIDSALQQLIMENSFNQLLLGAIIAILGGMICQLLHLSRLIQNR